MTIDPTGPHCYCGAQGCWETIASGTALAKWHNQQSDEAMDLFLAKVQTQSFARTGLIPANMVTIVPAAFRPNADLLGA